MKLKPEIKKFVKDHLKLNVNEDKNSCFNSLDVSGEK